MAVCVGEDVWVSGRGYVWVRCGGRGGGLCTTEKVCGVGGSVGEESNSILLLA